MQPTCRIRPGTRLALSAGGIFTIYGGPKNLNGTINRYWPDLLSVGLWVDGVRLTPHLMKTPFLHARVPYYNAQLFGVPKTLISFVSKDYFALLSPLSPGWHTVTTTTTFTNPNTTYTMTLHLNVR